MIHVTIRVQTLQDAKEGKGLFEHLTDKPGVATLTHFGILEHGMQSGKTSVMFLIKLPDGRQFIAETSAAIFETMAGALKGAEQRFSDNKATKN